MLRAAACSSVNLLQRWCNRSRTWTLHSRFVQCCTVDCTLDRFATYWRSWSSMCSASSQTSLRRFGELRNEVLRRGTSPPATRTQPSLHATGARMLRLGRGACRRCAVREDVRRHRSRLSDEPGVRGQVSPSAKPASLCRLEGQFLCRGKGVRARVAESCGEEVARTGWERYEIESQGAIGSEFVMIVVACLEYSTSRSTA